MDIQPIFYNTLSHKSAFQLSQGKRPWDMLLMISDGSFSFRADDREFIVGKDEIAFFPMNTEFTRTIIDPISIHQFCFTSDHSHPYIKGISCGKLNLPKQHVRSIIETLEILTGFESHQDIFRHTIEHIIIENYLYDTNDSSIGIQPPEDINQTIHYMREHLNEKINIEELAELIHLSHVGYLWKFKRYTGTTPSLYLSMLRMQFAKQLLLEGNSRVNEIATLCGYSNAYYFCNAFKKFYHISPMQYRKIAFGQIPAQKQK